VVIARIAPGRADRLAVRRIEPLLAAPFQRRACGDERPVFEDADLVGENMDVEDARRFVSGTL
jgi:hypothetical protein